MLALVGKIGPIYIIPKYNYDLCGSNSHVEGVMMVYLLSLGLIDEASFTFTSHRTTRCLTES